MTEILVIDFFSNELSFEIMGIKQYLFNLSI